MYSTVYDDVMNDINTELRVLKKTQPSRAARIKKIIQVGGCFSFFLKFSASLIGSLTGDKILVF